MHKNKVIEFLLTTNFLILLSHLNAIVNSFKSHDKYVQILYPKLIWVFCTGPMYIREPPARSCDRKGWIYEHDAAGGKTFCAFSFLRILL